MTTLHVNTHKVYCKLFMFARFFCALLGFWAHKFPVNSEKKLRFLHWSHLVCVVTNIYLPEYSNKRAWWNYCSIHHFLCRWFNLFIIGVLIPSPPINREITKIFVNAFIPKGNYNFSLPHPQKKFLSSAFNSMFDWKIIPPFLCDGSSIFVSLTIEVDINIHLIPLCYYNKFHYSVFLPYTSKDTSPNTASSDCVLLTNDSHILSWI